MSSQGFLEQLRIQHYASVAFPLDRASLDRAAACFLEFLGLAETVKRQLHFSARSHRASADGYTDKSDIANKDPKQFFHSSPLLQEQEICRRMSQQHPEVARFFQAAEGIYRHVEQTLLSLYQNYLPAFLPQISSDGGIADGILRFLSYAPRPDHRFCAQAHFDKGFSTLAIADSAPGLRIGCCNAHPLHPVQYREGTALFMPAWMLFQASSGEIKPAWHDVIHSPAKQDVNAFCARWSIVFFLNSPQMPFSSWQDVHTPLH